MSTDPVRAGDASAADSGAELAAEQAVVDTVHARVDRLRARVAEQLQQALRGPGPGTPQARTERDAVVPRLAARLATLDRLDDGLVLGRLDRADGSSAHIGRIGVRDERGRSLLVDWRAPAAEAFYRATAAEPGDVVRRRHLRVRRRRVVAIQDDLLTGPGVPVSVGVPVSGEAVLLAAVGEARGARMRDIVGTLQAEQDRIIRSPLPGVLVVRGAPGTGKTAVALHRAAYLLHAHRDRLERAGVLLVGPSSRFLDYVSDVLPSLGETSVVSTTLAGLLPVAVGASEPRAVAALKGDDRLAAVLARAVRHWQRVPPAPVPLEVEGAGAALLRPEVVRRAVAAARRTREPHHVARVEFCRIVLDDLRRQLDPDGEDPAVARLLLADADVRREVNRCWLPRTPEQVLARLWADRQMLARAAEGLLDAAEQGLLHRPAGAPWTPADVPLLDELHALLGPLPETRREARLRRQEAADDQERRRFAADSLASLGLADHLDADLVARRAAAEDDLGELADRAARDPGWAFGHVVVDEAQELSAMAWRMLRRRCPSRSMTVVGDVHQATEPGAVADWSRVRELLGARSFRVEELTVNYRSTAAVMETARRVLGETDPGPLRSLRAGEPTVVVRRDRLDAAGLAAALAGHTPTEGTAAAILPRGVPAPELPGWTVLAPDQAKGLEFDVVAVVEPEAIRAEPGRGRADLYVALTRPTQRLVIVQSSPGAPPGPRRW